MTESEKRQQGWRDYNAIYAKDNPEYTPISFEDYVRLLPKITQYEPGQHPWERWGRMTVADLGDPIDLDNLSVHETKILLAHLATL